MGDFTFLRPWLLCKAGASSHNLQFSQGEESQGFMFKDSVEKWLEQSQGAPTELMACTPSAQLESCSTPLRFLWPLSFHNALFPNSQTWGFISPGSAASQLLGE